MADDTGAAAYPAAQVHDGIEELFEDVFWVRGSMRMAPAVRIMRNMVILRQAGELTVIGPVRLDAGGEAALEALGQVRHVVRLGNFHGLDDAYYVDRFGAEFWCQAASNRYVEPTPTHLLDEGSVLPVADTEVFAFGATTAPEGAILLRRHGGLLITCDSVQNYADRRHCSLVARVMMPFLGFSSTTLIGPRWLVYMTPEGGTLQGDFERLLALPFSHMISAHGSPRRGDAHAAVAAAVAKTFAA